MTSMAALNGIVFQFIHHFAGLNVFLDDTGIFFAEYLPYLLVAGFLLFAYYEREWRKMFYVFAEGAVAIMLSRGLVTEIVRFFYHHERPFSFYGFAPLITGAGWSFPSGHAAWFFALSMVVWYFDRNWGIAYFALSALNGIARIYVGVHWPLDVLGGAILGVLSAVVVHALFRETRSALYRVPLSGTIREESRAGHAAASALRD